MLHISMMIIEMPTNKMRPFCKDSDHMQNLNNIVVTGHCAIIVGTVRWNKVHWSDARRSVEKSEILRE